MPICKHCGLFCKLERGLKQHLAAKAACAKKERARLGLPPDDKDDEWKDVRSVSVRTRSPPLPIGFINDVIGRQKPTNTPRKRKASEEMVAPRRNPKAPAGKTTGLTGEDYQDALVNMHHSPPGKTSGMSEEDLQRHLQKTTGLSDKDLQQVQQQYSAMTQEDMMAWQKIVEQKHESFGYGSKLQGQATKTARLDHDSDDDSQGCAGTGDGNESDEQQQTAGQEEEKEVEEETKTADEESDGQVLDGDPQAEGQDFNHDRQINIGVNTEMNAQFKAYCQEAKQNMLPDLTEPEVQAVKLLDIMRRKKAPMDSYGEIMLWHYRSTGELEEEETLKDSNDYISRKKLIERLKIRYNMKNKFPISKPLVLPFSKAKVDLVCHDAWGCVESLLTDPRLTDDDFWFFDDDPRAPPPENRPFFADLQTGRAYREAARQYKKHPNQIPLPIVMYLDGADTGQMKSMPINALKMTLGIFTRTYREYNHAWRVLGHVANVSKAKSKAKRTMRQSGHIAAAGHELAQGEGSNPQAMPQGDPSGPSRDLHAMLDILLEGYRDIQKRGFKWDLRYRGNTYKDLEFIPFVLFIKCDTKEANSLCGQYSSAKSDYLCRYCFCPSAIADDPSAREPFRTVKWVKSFSDKDDYQGAKKYSQHNLPNAFHKIRFSPENDRGIHGACPSEMLHAVLLGNFMYLRDTLYEQVGEYSQLAETIDKLSQLYGSQFARQSERSMPKCKFTNGIREGKLNAKEYRGILLVMAAIF